VRRRPLRPPAARGRAAPSPPEATISPRVLVHLAWSAAILVAAGALVWVELSAACPGGGPLAFGSCERVRPFAIGVVALAAALYVAGLSAVLAWTGGLLRRGAADRGAARDWYVLAAALGLPVAPLFAFTLVSALR
jgi:hypothetical protein